MTDKSTKQDNNSRLSLHGRWAGPTLACLLAILCRHKQRCPPGHCHGLYCCADGSMVDHRSHTAGCHCNAPSGTLPLTESVRKQQPARPSMRKSSGIWTTRFGLPYDIALKSDNQRQGAVLTEIQNNHGVASRTSGKSPCHFLIFEQPRQPVFLKSRRKVMQVNLFPDDGRIFIRIGHRALEPS